MLDPPHACPACARLGRTARRGPCPHTPKPALAEPPAAQRGANHEGRRRAHKLEASRHPWRAARQRRADEPLDDEVLREIDDALKLAPRRHIDRPALPIEGQPSSQAEARA